MPNEDVMKLSAELDRTRRRVYRLVRAASAKPVTRRPDDGGWTALENVQHLIFAEQLHLGRFLPERVAWSPLGVKHHSASKFWPAGTQATDDPELVLQPWTAVHRPIRKALAFADVATVGEALSRHIKHLEQHIEKLLRDPDQPNSAKRAMGALRR